MDWSLNRHTNSGDSLSANLAWALTLIWRSGHSLTLANAGLTFLQGVVPLVGLYLLKLIVDTVSAALAAPNAAAFKDVVYLILLSAGVVLVEKALGTAAELVKATHTHLATDRIYEMLHAKSVEVDLESYENSDYYDTLHRARQEASYRPSRILEDVFKIGESTISLGAIAVLLLTFHWSVPAFLVAAAVPGLLVRFRFAKELYSWGRQRTPAQRLALYFSSMLTGDTHAKEIRALELGDIFVGRFNRLRRQVHEERIDLLKRRSVADLLAQTGAVIPSFGLYGFLAYRAVYGLMTIGDLVMFYQAVQRSQSYVGKLLGSISDLYENGLFLSSVHEFLALEPRITEPATPAPMPQTIRRGIVFSGVKFRYPGSDRIVLDGIDLTIRPGEHVAIVGENGCGKTTFVKLLSRLYDPIEGSIAIDGIDLRELSVTALRRKISIVFQDYARYQVSAGENIWFGNVQLPPQDASIAEAARKSGAHEAIVALKDGYDTVLGKVFGNGEEFSIGEWQKIALARAFLRDAEIVILDEPTSALDPKAEYEVFNKFHRLFHGRTAVIISHRLSTVRMADRIYFLDNGTVVESGSHDDLIDQGGRYADMFEMQAQYYR